MIETLQGRWIKGLFYLAGTAFIAMLSALFIGLWVNYIAALIVIGIAVVLVIGCIIIYAIHIYFTEKALDRYLKQDPFLDAMHQSAFQQRIRELKTLNKK